MDEKQLQALANELAKNFKTPEDLSQFKSSALKPLSMQRCPPWDNRHVQRVVWRRCLSGTDIKGHRCRDGAGCRMAKPPTGCYAVYPIVYLWLYRPESSAGQSRHQQISVPSTDIRRAPSLLDWLCQMTSKCEWHDYAGYLQLVVFKYCSGVIEYIRW